MGKKERERIWLSGWLGFNILLVYLLAAAALQFNYRLRNHISVIPINERINSLQVADMDGNGSEELILLKPAKPLPDQNLFSCMNLFNNSADTRYTFFIDQPIATEEFAGQPLDFDHDGLPEIPLLSYDRKSIRIRFWDTMGNTKKTIYLPTFSWPATDQTRISYPHFADLDGDGSLELVVCVTTFWRGLPRGVVAYNLDSQSRLWEYSMGSQPHRLKILDINGDGKREIILGTTAPHNSAKSNDTDDDHSYLVLINHRGEGIPPTPVSLGGQYTKINFDCGDIDGDGNIEIITSKTCHMEQSSEPGEIFILDGRTMRRKKYLSGSRPPMSLVHYFLRGKERLLAVGDSSGRVQLLNGQLNPEAQIQLPRPAIVLGVIPLGENAGSAYLGVMAGTNEFYLLDGRLRIATGLTIPGNSDFVYESDRFVSLRNFRENAGFLVMQGQGFLVLKREPSWSLAWSTLLKIRLLLYLILFVGANFLIFHFFRQRKQTSKAWTPGEGSWLEMAQEIAHQMKTPLFTIQLENEKLQPLMQNQERQDPKKLAAISKSILEDVAKLKGLSRDLMKILSMKKPKLQKTDVNYLIEKLAERYRGATAGNIAFEFDLDSEPGPALLDSGQLEEALANLIENAIESMPEGGKIRIATLFKVAPRKKAPAEMIIEIEDNGCGIPADKLDVVFEPYFTTKKEGLGLGLAICRRIVEAHGGRIEVHSREGLGTRIALHLPFKEA